MAEPNIESDALVRRLSNDIIQFKTSHHLPDDLESSINSKFNFFIEYISWFD
jgi:hypothetical protein